MGKLTTVLGRVSRDWARVAGIEIEADKGDGSRSGKDWLHDTGG